MGEVIVVTSGKGGVGKTTTTVNLGAALALKGKKIVLVDTESASRIAEISAVVTTTARSAPAIAFLKPNFRRECRYYYTRVK